MRLANKKLLLLSLIALVFSACHPRVRGPVLNQTASDCREYDFTKSDDLDQLVTREASTFELTCFIKKANLAVPKPYLHIALAYYYLADAETDDGRRYALAKKGYYNGDWAIKTNAEDGRSYYGAAVNLGLMMQQDLLKAMGNVSSFKEMLEKSIEMVPTFDEAGAYRVLGQLYVRAPSWPASIGDPDMAVELLEKAVEIAPNHPVNHLFLVEALWESEGQDSADDAKEHFLEAEELFKEEKWQNQRKQWQVLIEKMAKKLKIK